MKKEPSWSEGRKEERVGRKEGMVERIGRMEEVRKGGKKEGRDEGRKGEERNGKIMIRKEEMKVF